MPYKSRAQAAFFHEHKRQLERQGVDVSEWDEASKGMKLPEHARGLSQGKKAQRGSIARSFNR